MDLDGKLAALELDLQRLGRVVVAFSGGADSAFLAAVATRTLGPTAAHAVTAVSPSLAGDEEADCRQLADEWGMRWTPVVTHEMERAAYRMNDTDRCFHCKAELLDVLKPLAASLGMAHVATGTNADDAVDPFRPGIRAAAERGAITPLRYAGLTKAEIRLTSRSWNLPTWDKPAAACLSSRVAYGLTITPLRLARVERAERALRQRLTGAGLAVCNLRVRDLGEVARVEIDAALVPALLARPHLIDEVLGFDRVEVDPIGFRSGSMNELVASPSNG